MADFLNPNELQRYLQGIGYNFRLQPGQQPQQVRSALAGTSFRGKPLLGGVPGRAEQLVSIDVPGEEFGVPGVSMGPATGTVLGAAGLPGQARSALAQTGAGMGIQQQQFPITAGMGAPPPAAALALPGALPSAPTGGLPVTGAPVTEAVDAVTGGATPTAPQAPATSGGLFLTGLGLGQLQASVGTPAAMESLGAVTTLVGGLMRTAGVGGMWGVGLGLLGTLLNVSGQGQAQQMRQDYRQQILQGISNMTRIHRGT